MQFLYRKLKILLLLPLTLVGVFVFGASHISCGQNFPVAAVNAAPDKLATLLTSSDFAKFTHSPFGKTMEPVNVVVVGSATELNNAFQDIGWTKAAPLKEKTALELAYAAIFNRSDVTAPVTPSCYGGVRQEVAFEQPTDGIRQRHHVRFWRTGLTVNREPVWVGAASFDESLHYLIAHRIAPNVDAERNYLQQSLVAHADVTDVHTIPLVKPLTGSNQAGDHFYTDGRAYLIWLIHDA
ncbi:hypothetical protein COV04_01165 [Candidatus Uhrbacteria bacterium CG10_big_fil_rev_8_21_14_0_10_48_11]|uniref:LssY-like C-terminal domain-containing protein n=1 Tax=Candidatus Uhrbacteria bacterium CG10_big_fil_rev_8_21_14_0_10_48_11 TaxID=1975037 RepID=A0A2M8LF96_9BACT|nr:MAG: hypothetical protein COV04_01165 [Candidatus Uhrbacteria bacterium CG10_big_fil_rev_8_21_14_0_10_48_11]